MPGSKIPVIPLQEIFALTPKGRQEFRSSVTTLSAAQLELLLRCNGTARLHAVRAAMAALSDSEFISSFKTVYQAGLLHETRPDAFLATSTAQLRQLSLVSSDPSSAADSNTGAFSVGLVWRNTRAPRERDRDAPLTAVVVEDDPALATFIQYFLAMEGFVVRCAKNRAEVLKALQTLPVADLVLLDGTLPDVDGFDVLRTMRAHPVLGQVPTLMLTGRATRTSVLQAVVDGADGYLTKPFQAEGLVHAVRTVTGLSDGSGLAQASDPWSNPDAVGRRETLTGAPVAPKWGLL